MLSIMEQKDKETFFLHCYLYFPSQKSYAANELKTCVKWGVHFGADHSHQALNSSFVGNVEMSLHFLPEKKSFTWQRIRSTTRSPVWANVSASSTQTVPRLSCKCVSYPLPPSGVSVSDPRSHSRRLCRDLFQTPATSTFWLPFYCSGEASRRRAMRWAELALVANCTEGDSFCQVTSAGGDTFSTCQKLNLWPLWRQRR